MIGTLKFAKSTVLAAKVSPTYPRRNGYCKRKQNQAEMKAVNRVTRKFVSSEGVDGDAKGDGHVEEERNPSND